MKLYREDGTLWFDSSSDLFVLMAVLLAFGMGFGLGIVVTTEQAAARAAAAVEPAGQAGADLDAACCPRWRAPQQDELDALTAAGGSLLVYVDADGACCTLSHNGDQILGYAGHPLDAARGCLEAWIAEGGAR